jgi:hypothetical protein
MDRFNDNLSSPRLANLMTENDAAGLFSDCYDSSRARFRAHLHTVRRGWSSASLQSFTLDLEEDLTIDRIEAPALKSKDRLLILTTGEHGIEAYVGTAMLELCIREVLPQLNPENTGLLLVHAINPWGMKYRRRVNVHNVDLNRNFLFPQEARPANPRYARIADFLNPAGRPGSWLVANLVYGAGLLSALLKLGFKDGLGAILLGQYERSSGLYYGGENLQSETCHMIDLFRNLMPEYQQTVLLDMHTGYGPRNQMSLVNSYLEPRSSAELAERFAYSPVFSATPEEFYAIQGDMIDFVYSLQASLFSDKALYATSFEFGTYGNGLFDHLRELRTMILENQVYHYGAGSSKLRQRAANDFEALYFPQVMDWQAKAVQAARLAYSGILKAEGYIP